MSVPIGKTQHVLTLEGSSTDNFLKRWLAFFIGGVVALIVEVVFLPVKARTRLVESLEAAMRQIGEMETCVAGGIEEGINLDIYDPRALERFEHASGKANCALTAAETFRRWITRRALLPLTARKCPSVTTSPGSKVLSKVWQQYTKR